MIMFLLFSFSVLYVPFFMHLEVEGIKVLKVGLNSSLSTSAEIQNSSLSSLSEFTLCGRVLNHQFSHLQQTILILKSGDDHFGFGTFPLFPCNGTYYLGIYRYSFIGRTRTYPCRKSYFNPIF